MIYAEAASKKDVDFVEDNYALAIQTFASILSAQRAEVAVCVLLDNVDKGKSFVTLPPFATQKNSYIREWLDSQPMTHYEDNLWINIQYHDVYTLERILI